MTNISATARKLLLLSSLPLLTTSAFAQSSQDEDDDAYATIIVTAAIRQGGAQDVQHFRSISLDQLENRGLPSANSLTMEGLLGEHDLSLPQTGECSKLFCVSPHAIPAQITGRENDTHFLGIGFDSGIDAETYRAQPLSLIAVIDRSGSMSGPPIERVKEGLHAALDTMREGDRLGIVLYGSTTLVHQEMLDIDSNRRALHRAIDAIEIDGSTYMEAGLKLGYATAIEELPNSHGKTRLMLFTDENPNVGNTSPEGFMAQAVNGSRQGVGMTTIGVGAHYDGELAKRISSVQGGNLFFLAEEGSGSELFSKEFENMVSEVAQDLTFSIDPAPGVQITGVYGVPDDLITTSSTGTVTVTIGSVFLSSNGGGIYASLAGEMSDQETPLADISVAYTVVQTQRRESDSEAVFLTEAPAPENLAKAQLLVNQYFGMTQALALYHDENDPQGAATALAELSSQIETSGIGGMSGELELVNNLQLAANKLAGNSDGPTLAWEVLGEWQVVRQDRVGDLSRGDIVEITGDGEFITTRMSGRDEGEDIWQNFSINERQLHIKNTRLVLDYKIRGNRLTLRDRLEGVKIEMERISG